MIGKLLIASQDYDFSSSDSTLLTNSNYRDIIESKNLIDCCTSIADCGIKIGRINKDLFAHCQTIECVDLTWNYVINRDNHMSYMQVCYMLATEFRNISTGFEELVDQTTAHITYQRALRKNKELTLWVAGCSWSSATGVKPTERWGHLVANELGWVETNLAQAGGSVWDASDQILRADIQKGDIVVWGLTSLGRVDIVINNLLESFAVREAIDMKVARAYYNPDYFFSNTQCLIAIRQIQQVINYCNKIGVQLYLINFLDCSWIPFSLHQKENFLDLYRTFNDDTLLQDLIDVGTDGEHPGPLQHEAYAKDIITLIQGEQL